MTRDPVTVLADQLVERARSGRPDEALAIVDAELIAAGLGAHPALHYARAVAHDVLGQHREAARSAAAGVDAASEAGRDGWWAICLAMRAVQLLQLGNDDPTELDETEVLRDLARAEVALASAGEDVFERAAGYSSLATAYERLRLYELAVPMHLASCPDTPEAQQLAPETPAVQQLHLASLHLSWALELCRVGLMYEMGEQCRQALVHALQGQLVAAGTDEQVWVERAMLLAACAQAQIFDPLPAVEAARASLAVLDGVGSDHERTFTAPLLALALARAEQPAEGLAVIDAAMAVRRRSTDPLVLAALQHARVVLLCPTSAGARAGLAYADTLALELWHQRARRLSVAEGMLRNERTRVEHEAVSRSPDVDVLTGTASRRAFDRRAAALEALRHDAGLLVCAVVIDIDGLTAVNDTFGQQTGDHVLREVGRVLRAAVEGSELLGRVGGDEFAALLSAGADDGRGVAERMLAAVRALSWPAELIRAPSVSIGVARTNADRSVQQALADADKAMHTARQSGGDAVVVSDEAWSGARQAR
jgi:diguanylate cyclase (GGDEF)-like protein